jgi:hypothetical protein
MQITKAGTISASIMAIIALVTWLLTAGIINIPFALASDLQEQQSNIAIQQQSIQANSDAIVSQNNRYNQGLREQYEREIRSLDRSITFLEIKEDALTIEEALQLSGFRSDRDSYIRLLEALNNE